MSQGRALILLAGLALAPSAYRSLRPELEPLPVHSTEHTAEADRVLFGEKMDLNRADAAALELIPGIGPALAARIVEHREDRGPFAGVEEVERVRGIGPSKLEAIKAWAEVRADSATAAPR